MGEGADAGGDDDEDDPVPDGRTYEGLISALGFAFASGLQDFSSYSGQPVGPYHRHGGGSHASSWFGGGLERGRGQHIACCGHGDWCGAAGRGYGQHLLHGHHSVRMFPPSYQCQVSILSFVYIPGQPVGRHLHDERNSGQAVGGGGVCVQDGGLWTGSARGGVWVGSRVELISTKRGQLLSQTSNILEMQEGAMEV